MVFLLAVCIGKGAQMSGTWEHSAWGNTACKPASVHCCSWKLRICQSNLFYFYFFFLFFTTVFKKYEHISYITSPLLSFFSQSQKSQNDIRRIYFTKPIRIFQSAMSCVFVSVYFRMVLKALILTREYIESF